MVAIPTAAPLAGFVKAVPSGDTLILMNKAAPVKGPPPEMRLTLSSLKAPLLSRDAQSDDPFSWASREYLREKLIGKTVNFRIDYRVESLKRIFATIFSGEGNSVNMDVVTAGMARVRKPAVESEECSPEFEALVAAEKQAEEAHVGLHAGGVPPVARRVPAADVAVLEGNQLVAACKGTTLKGVVEYVSNGSCVKTIVKSIPISADGRVGDRILTLCMSGIQCPGFRRAEGADPSQPPKPLPFALNARFHTEIRLLNRDVNISLEGVDRNGILFATLHEPTSKMNIGEELLRLGYAKTVSWSIDLSDRAPALRAAERHARDNRLGVWQGFKPANVNSELFTGKCVEVVSGDMIVVLADNTGKTRRISLASVRASRGDRPGRDRTSIPVGPAADAKEALRKKLIGRRVKVKVEYTRAPSEESARKDVMVFATVSREGDSKNIDVALPLISSGLLTVIKHRGEEDRAGLYEEYLERQKSAMDAKRGLHGASENSSMRINNLTGSDAKKRSRDVLAGLQRNGPHRGVVEYVSSASRYRVFLTSESMLITLALRAVKCPSSTRRTYAPDGSIQNEVPGEPHGDEAADFAREHVMQREVEVDIQNVDRVGAFLGNITIISPSGEKTDVSELLLRTGHGYMHESFDPSRDSLGSKYTAIQKEAKEAKKGGWVHYVEPTVEERSTAREEPKQKSFVGVVCEIGFSGKIFVQESKLAKSSLSTIETGLASMSLDQAPETPVGGLRPGLVVAAKFSADNRWYRAKIKFVHKEKGVEVRFMDYGNEEIVDPKNIRRFGAAVPLANMAPVAVEVALAHIVVPDEEDPCGVPAGEFLREIMYGQEVTVTVKKSEGPAKVVGDILIPSVGGSDSSTGPTSVREQLLRTGLARIIRKKDRASRAAFKELRPLEEVGIASREYLWNYGEAFESDCDEETS